MREFLKAFTVIFVILFASLATLRYAPVAFLDPIRQHEILKENVFDVWDQGLRLGRGFSRDLVNDVELLKDYAWLHELLAEEGETAQIASDQSAEADHGAYRAPANQPSQTEDSPGEGGTSASGLQSHPHASTEIKGSLGELLGKNYQLLSHSALSTEGVGHFDAAVQGRFLIFLSPESKAHVWNVKANGKFYSVFELRSGSVELTAVRQGSAKVLALLPSGLYKELGAGEKWIAAAVQRKGNLVDGIKQGTRAELKSFIAQLKKAPQFPQGGAPVRERAPASVPSSTATTDADRQSGSGRSLDDGLE